MAQLLVRHLDDDVKTKLESRARKATLATRNRRHFEGLGLALADPRAE